MRPLSTQSFAALVQFQQGEGDASSQEVSHKKARLARE